MSAVYTRKNNCGNYFTIEVFKKPFYVPDAYIIETNAIENGLSMGASCKSPVCD